MDISASTRESPLVRKNQQNLSAGITAVATVCGYPPTFVSSIAQNLERTEDGLQLQDLIDACESSSLDMSQFAGETLDAHSNELPDLDGTNSQQQMDAAGQTQQLDITHPTDPQTTSSDLQDHYDGHSLPDCTNPQGITSSQQIDRVPRAESLEPAPPQIPGDVDECVLLLERENQLLEKLHLCEICKRNHRNITYLPCGHLISCNDCDKSIDTCSRCQRRILAVVTTYFS